MSATTIPDPTRTLPENAGTDDELHELLDDDLAFETYTRSGLSSHLSMELYALHRLGASGPRLREAFAGYAGSGAVQRKDPASLERAREQVWSDGIATTVRDRVPRLVEAAGAQWFHAIIRLAYALEANHTGQVANALMSWEAAADQVVAPQSGLMAGIVVDDPSMADLANAALCVFAGTDNLATLHMVTGSHAARVVAPYLDEDTRSLLHRHMADALTANHLATGAPSPPGATHLQLLRDATVPPWDQIASAAVGVPDAHVAKVVHTARSEFGVTGDPLYQWCAARAAGVLTAPDRTG